MKKFNLFYFVIVVTGIFLFAVLRPDNPQELSFFGVAESRATEINYNYPVVVDEILVKPGQAVKAGQVLLRLSRRKSKETLEDQRFRIAELKAEEALWEEKQRNKIEELELEHQSKLAEIDRKIESVQKELAYKKSLIAGLGSIEPVQASYKPLEEELERYMQQKDELNRLHTFKIESLREELQLGKNPYREQINRLIAESEFEESQKVQPIIVTAPTDGLVGDISCKEAEHISSYKTLLTFYEPHSGIIKGYVHEDLIMEVEIGQKFCVSSLKDESVKYQGTVIGLGSRIVEIPARLRKIEALKAYGREVLIEISKDNTFLQKEKVSITHCSES